MARLSRSPLALAIALCSVSAMGAAPAWAQGEERSALDRWAGFVAEASSRFGIPEEWIRRVMQAESGGRTMLRGRPIVSHAGAMGLMQLMPGTWAAMRAAHRLGADPHAPRDNILAGTAYLRAMYDRFGYPGLFGAYNAGPARYAAHLRGRRLPTETVAYMAAVSGDRRERGPSPVPSRPSTGVAALFAVRNSDGVTAASIATDPAPASDGGLFVRLRTVPAVTRDDPGSE